MKIRLIQLLLLIGFTTALYGQSSEELPPVFLFEEDTISMGKMKNPEVGIPLVQQFHFQVLPNQTVKIKEVKPDCACNIASYPERWLTEGDMGSITVRFTPYKLGKFEKNFAVMVYDRSGKEGTMTIQLKGYIEPKQPKVDLDFPYRCGNLRLRKRLISFGGIGNKTLVKQKIEFYNDGNQPISFLDSMQLPPYVEVVMGDSVVQPKSVCQASIFYHPELRGNFGYSLDNIQLFTNDPAQSKVEMEVAASVQPEKNVKTANSPELWLRSEVMDLGELPLSSVGTRDIVVRFVVYNRGVEDLVIKDVEAGENTQVIAISQNQVQKGKSSQIQVQVKGLSGTGEKVRKVVLHTNDPIRPQVELVVVARLP